MMETTAILWCWRTIQRSSSRSSSRTTSKGARRGFYLYTISPGTTDRDRRYAHRGRFSSGRFDRDEPLQKEHLLVVGLSRPFRADDRSPFELWRLVLQGLTEQHPVLLMLRDDRLHRSADVCRDFTFAEVETRLPRSCPILRPKDGLGYGVRCSPYGPKRLYRAFGFFPSEDKRLTWRCRRARLCKKAAPPKPKLLCESISPWSEAGRPGWR